MTWWSDIPPDVLMEIDDRLPKLADRVVLRAVCTSWRCSLSKIPDRKTMQFPWLIQPAAPLELFDPLENRFYETDFSANTPREKLIFIGSTSGWLITIGLKSPVINAINPITGQVIQLPPRTQFPDVKNYYSSRIGTEYLILDYWNSTVSASAQAVHTDYTVKIILSPGSAPGDFVAFAIFGIDTHHLAYCKSSCRKWVLIDFGFSFAGDFADIILHNGLLYVLSSLGELAYFDEIPPTDEASHVAGSVVDSTSSPIMCLVESSDGALLLVVVGDDGSAADGRFRIFKYKNEFCSILSGWCELNQIGTEMIFLGSISSISISSQDFPDFEGNCIYLPGGTPEASSSQEEMDSGDDETSRIRVFSLARSMETVKVFKNKKSLAGRFNHEAIWLTPNLHRGFKQIGRRSTLITCINTYNRTMKKFSKLRKDLLPWFACIMVCITAYPEHLLFALCFVIFTAINLYW